MTKNNKMILDIVNSSCDHPSADQIFIRAREQNPKVVLATVYNNLNSLVRDRKIRRISISGKPDCYDNLTRHDHKICIQCGSISDVMIDDVTPLVKEYTDGIYLSYDLCVNYICPDCCQEILNKLTAD